jgi:hypothetical protein
VSVCRVYCIALHVCMCVCARVRVLLLFDQMRACVLSQASRVRPHVRSVQGLYGFGFVALRRKDLGVDKVVQRRRLDIEVVAEANLRVIE